MSKFRDKYKTKKEDLTKRHQESIDRKAGVKFGTIFNKDAIPDGIKFWSCGEGEHIVDIVPWFAGPDVPNIKTQEGDLEYVVDVWVHRGIGILEQTYVCPAFTWKKPCPICDELKKHPEKYTEQEQKDFKSKRRTVYLIWVHDNNKEEEKGLQIWEIAHWFFQDKIDSLAEIPRGGGVVLFSDPDTGKSVAWKREGTGAANTNFLAHQFLDREIKIPDDILDQSFALDTAIHMHVDYDELYMAFMDEEIPNPNGDPGAQEEYPAEVEQEEVDNGEFICPAGGAFGADIDSMNECPTCPNYDFCMEEQDNIKKAEAESESSAEKEAIEREAGEQVELDAKIKERQDRLAAKQVKQQEEKAETATPAKTKPSIKKETPVTSSRRRTRPQLRKNK